MKRRWAVHEALQASDAKLDTGIISTVDTNTYKFPKCYSLYSDNIARSLDPYTLPMDITNIINDYNMVELGTTMNVPKLHMGALVHIELQEVIDVEYVTLVIVGYLESMCHPCRRSRNFSGFSLEMYESAVLEVYECNLSGGCCSSKYICPICWFETCLGCNQIVTITNRCLGYGDARRVSIQHVDIASYSKN